MSPELEEQLFAYLNKADDYYKDKFNRAVVGKEKVIQILESSEDFDYDLNAYKNLYFNESLSDLVRNINVKDRIIPFFMIRHQMVLSTTALTFLPPSNIFYSKPGTPIPLMYWSFGL